MVIPVYNDKDTIKQICDAVKAVNIEKEIIFVDDCSTDGTCEIIRQLADDITKVIFHDHNIGKGAALRTGFTGDIVVIQDADLEYEPSQYPKLIQPILEGKADVVYGSRFVTGDYHRVIFFWHMVGNTVLTLLSNMLTNLNLTDMETCYKVFRRDVMEKITVDEDRFGFEPEITAKIAKLDVRIYEVGFPIPRERIKRGKNWMERRPPGNLLHYQIQSFSLRDSFLMLDNSAGLKC